TSLSTPASRTMKRKLKWIAVVLGVLLVALGAGLFLLPRDRISAESWKQISIGTTEKEVEVILGRPGLRAGDLKGNEFFDQRLQLGEPDNGVWMHHGLKSHKFWTSQRGLMQIAFDPRGCVSGKALWQSGEPSSFIDRIQHWLGW